MVPIPTSIYSTASIYITYICNLHCINMSIQAQPCLLECIISSVQLPCTDTYLDSLQDLYSIAHDNTTLPEAPVLQFEVLEVYAHTAVVCISRCQLGTVAILNRSMYWLQLVLYVSILCEGGDTLCALHDFLDCSIYSIKP